MESYRCVSLVFCLCLLRGDQVTVRKQTNHPVDLSAILVSISSALLTLLKDTTSLPLPPPLRDLTKALISENTDLSTSNRPWVCLKNNSSLNTLSIASGCFLWLQLVHANWCAPEFVLLRGEELEILWKHWDHFSLLCFLPYTSILIPSPPWWPQESQPEKEHRGHLPPMEIICSWTWSLWRKVTGPWECS